MNTENTTPEAITKNVVAMFHYTLHNEAGDEVENSRAGDPIAYLHGYGNVIPGLEKAMEGKAPGESFEVTVAPEEGYGVRQENNSQRVPIKHLMEWQESKGKVKIRPGMVVAVNTEQGVRQVTVVKVGKFNVDVDTNHPLAGKTLTFKVDVVELRAASDSEISHGHAHGPGGHHHD
ncbi:MAG: peptidylprolyl isomerase [Pseudomonadales bacterium]|nr:peptidylprolyl isomerase [Pseudomonadales bacterium]